MFQPKKGDKVRFHPIIGGKHDGNVYECRSDIFALGSGEAVIQLKGKSGCVAVRALSPCEAPPQNTNCLEGMKCESIMAVGDFRTR